MIQDQRCGEAAAWDHGGLSAAASIQGPEQKIDHLEARRSMKLWLRFCRDEEAATAIEYGLIAAGIAVAIITVVQGLGTKLTSTFTTVKNALK